MGKTYEVSELGDMLIYQNENGDTKVDVYFCEQDVWMSQSAIAKMYNTTPQNITMHIKNIYEDGELDEESTCKEFLQVQTEGTRQIKRNKKHYNFRMILAIGYRVRSNVGIHFRNWASGVLEEYTRKGFAMNDERLKNPKQFGEDYFDELLERIRDIRASEKRFYQKICEIYKTSIDYSSRDEEAKLFFKTVQNKIHYGVHGHTAAELIMQRADATKDNMGLTAFEGAKVRKKDVDIAKNYLNEEEMSELNRVVTMYLDFAEDQARRHKYAYTVDFDSNELIKKAIEHIDRELFVSQLQYTVSKSEQRDVMDVMMVRESNSFYEAKSSTTILKHSETSKIKYDLIGKIAEGTVLTRKTVAAILQGISPIKFAMFKNNPEEFITKVISLIKEQKATMIVEHISYDQIEGKYDSSIFTAEKHASFDKAYRAKKHIQDYVFTDGTAEKSVERRFAEELDGAKEVCVYAKLPKGFAIPTPVGSYSPDWAIAFYEGTVKHIYFIAETKGTMESLELRPIEKAKISCARKLFNEISTENVVYHDVDSYQNLLNIMNSIEK